MSNTFARSVSSSGERRSNNNVPSPASFSAPATAWLRGLCRPLPLPCTNTTSPRAPEGIVRWPASCLPSAGSTISLSAPLTAARTSSSTTSSSEVGEKSEYQPPMAKNGSGVSTATTSSASRRSVATVSGGATGTAKITRAAPRSRATRTAARAVPPVARPSSTITTVRPWSGIAGRPPRRRVARSSTSARSRASTCASCASLTPAWRRTSAFRTRTPSSPTAPIPSSGWNGTPSFRTTRMSSGALSAFATSYATGTPPRGRPRTRGEVARRPESRSASRRPASRRSRKGIGPPSWPARNGHRAWHADPKTVTFGPVRGRRACLLCPHGARAGLRRRLGALRAGRHGAGRRPGVLAGRPGRGRRRTGPAPLGRVRSAEVGRARPDRPVALGGRGRPLHDARCRPPARARAPGAIAPGLQRYLRDVLERPRSGTRSPASGPSTSASAGSSPPWPQTLERGGVDIHAVSIPN